MLKRNKEKPAGPPPIGGVYAAAITPRRDREIEVDLGAMLELVDFIGGHPVQGIQVFGATGEFVHFTVEERSRYVSLLAKRSRVPVMANVSHSTLDGAIMMAEEAAGAGIAAVIVAPPYYYRYPAEAAEAFCLEFGRHISRWVRVYLYDLPAFGEPLSVESLERLLGTGMFAGLVDSSGDWPAVERLIGLGSASVMTGEDRLFAQARRAGAAGGVSDVACAIPELMLALERAVMGGGPVEALEARVGEFTGRAAEFPVPVGVKAALKARGVKAGPHASPLGEELSGRLARFEGWFREWLPGVLAECR
ncbi:MAG: dihydrodipicolinate synthase family protein [Acidobacteria bacterium]|nr:dihydrodipicolinate synthase family protein [Acidobacteriota bacterium]